MFTLTLSEEQVEVILNALGNYNKSGDALTVQTVTNQFDTQKAELTADAVDTAEDLIAQVQGDLPQAPAPKKSKKKA